MKPTRLVLQDAVVSLLARPGGAFLTALGATIGVTALVAVVGLTTTASAQITKRFDSAAATHITVELQKDKVDVTEDPASWDAYRNVQHLNGVKAATAVAKVEVPVTVATIEVLDPVAPAESEISVISATEHFLEAENLTISQGRMFDAGHDDRGEAVVLVGQELASRLGIISIERNGIIFLNDRTFRVLGIFDAEGAPSEYLSSVVMPSGIARGAFGVNGPREVRIRTFPGAARTIANQAPVAIKPEAPESLSVDYSAEPEALRDQIGDDTESLLIIVGVVCLLAGAVGIANSMLVSVMERTNEIGLRRAIGARRAHVVTQFMAESSALGALGGLMGSSLGAIVIVIGSAIQGWAPTADPLLFVAGVVLGAVTGLFAGIYPAWRATRIEPADALRAN